MNSALSAIIIIQNLAQIKALFKDTWETITGKASFRDTAGALIHLTVHSR